MTTNPTSGEKSVAALYPEVASEWDRETNEPVTAAKITPGSKWKAAWICAKCGHRWQARVNSRTRGGHGCPACGRIAAGKAKSAPRPGESLAEKLSGIAAEWHPTLNGELTPVDVGYASNKRVWWLCRTCHNEWQVAISNRAAGASCKKCASRAMTVPKPGNSLADRNPSVAAEWHPTRNGDLTPADVAFSRKDKAWWLCANCGHEWEASIGNRAKGAKCPPCAYAARGRALRGRSYPSGAAKPPSAPSKAATGSPEPGDSFAARFPEAAAEWHPTRNGLMAPDKVARASNRRAWWLCRACGHEWDAIIHSRGSGGAGCPRCGRRRTGRANATPKPEGSLAEKFPALAAEWHSIRNAPLTPDQVAAKSRRKAWWQCSTCDKQWEAAIYSRATGHGCRSCADRQRAVDFGAAEPGHSLAELDPEIAAQWHPSRNGALTASDVTANSGQTVWWLCDRRHEWQAMINNRRKARGCPKCTLWGTSVEEIRMRHELLAAGVPIDPNHEVIHEASGRVLQCDMVCSTWNVVIEFDGNRFHKLPDSFEKDGRKTRLLEEQGWTVIRVREDLPAIGQHDVVVALNSSEVTRAKAVLTKLRSLDFNVAEYDSYLTTDGPWGSSDASAYIKRRRIDKSLATLRPDLAAQWDSEKNGVLTPEDVTAGSGARPWWICPDCGHSWASYVYSRAGGGHGCPNCGRRKSSKRGK
ncbi:zinc-ribbon domain-containing protein [Mycolicibacter virginiensis]|uniref:zinc-ribbon domain-containing protein n=1 Tax=Mycolicibacter virginiensis TaxID=1795032 RepID=UPI001F035FEB|nr:zinc-ribbon domain-containing protein [Mycolicibacter virginiensis]ULP49235.1 zinc-ribbon domain-containing protein [Mycolicibacter virginiensis]